ncbi:MAG: hypothetical protein HY302_05670 [Opitutae bacterium]|nr:hypothetical protein [Opitutae bacterium]
MHRLARPLALLLLALWLPAMLHCELEAAEVQVLTHEDHHRAPDQSGSADDGFHALKEAAFTAHTPSVKVLPPAVAPVVVILDLAEVTRDWVEPALSPDRHPPPREFSVGWHFVRRAAPLARAPSLRA